MVLSDINPVTLLITLYGDTECSFDIRLQAIQLALIAAIAGYKFGPTDRLPILAFIQVRNGYTIFQKILHLGTIA